MNKLVFQQLLILPLLLILLCVTSCFWGDLCRNQRAWDRHHLRPLFQIWCLSRVILAYSARTLKNRVLNNLLQVWPRIYLVEASILFLSVDISRERISTASYFVYEPCCRCKIFLTALASILATLLLFVLLSVEEMRNLALNEHHLFVLQIVIQRWFLHLAHPLWGELVRWGGGLGPSRGGALHMRQASSSHAHLCLFNHDLRFEKKEL